MKTRLNLLFLSLLWSLSCLGQGIQTVQVHRLVPPQDVLYLAKTVRNVSNYPLTTSGLNSFTAAASSGAFSLTVTCPNGSLATIPAGVRPPLLPPCTSILGSTTSTIGLAVQYTYSLLHGGTLQLRGQGTGNYTMKIKRVDNQSMTLSNGDNPTLSANVAYPSGTVSGAYPLDWTLWGVPQVPIELTWTRDGVSYARTFTPAVTTSAQQLLVSGNSSPPSSNTTTPPVTSTATLAGGFGEGTYAQLLAYAPFTPSTNQLSSWPQGNTMQFLDNGQIRAGFLKSTGGALAYLSEGGGDNWVNAFMPSPSTLFEGEMSPDVGREAGPSIYGTPGLGFSDFSPFYGTNENTYKGPGSDDTGWNPVVGGSRAQDHSPILWFERRTVTMNGQSVEVIYIKTQPYQWSLHQVLGKVYFHMWYYLNGHAVKYFYIVENFRDDTQQKYFGRQQELPFAYLKAPLYRYLIYQGDSPGTSGPLSQINKSQPEEGGGPNNANATGDYIASENWIGALGTNDRGVFAGAGYTGQVNGRQFQGWSGNSSSNASAYINIAPAYNFDMQGTSAWTGFFYVGGLSDFRTWHNTNGPAKMPFSFQFDAGKTAGWYGEDAASKYNSDNRYEFTIGQKNQDGSAGGSFCSPFGSWKASDLNTIYIKGKFYGVSTINIQWKRPGDDDVYIEQFNNRQVSVIGDGVERTYTVSMAGVNNWNSIIGRIKIKLPYPYPNTNGDEKFIPTYIGTVNPN